MQSHYSDTEQTYPCPILINSYGDVEDDVDVNEW